MTNSRWLSGTLLTALLLLSTTCLHAADAAPPVSPLLKLRAVLEKRLASYHPVIDSEHTGLNRDNWPAKPPQGMEEPENQVRLSMHIDNPKDTSVRVSLDVTVHEYFNAKAAASSLWRSLISFPSDPGGIHFEDKHGYDRLVFQRGEIEGSSGQYYITCHMTGMNEGTMAFASIRPPRSPHYGWHAGLAEFVLDVWKEARGLPYAGGGIVPVAPGKVFRAKASTDGLINITSIPQAPEGTNTAPKTMLVYPNLKLGEIIEKRLAAYHPDQVKMSSGFSRRSLPKPFDEESDHANLSMYMDNPKDPSERVTLEVTLSEYADPTVADRILGRKLMSAPPGPGSIHFENKHGYDQLVLQGGELIGTLGRYYIRAALTELKGHPEAFAPSSSQHNPDYGWHAGLAEFVLDAWKQASGLLHAGSSIVQVPPGKVFRAVASTDGLINRTSVPQTPEEMNTVLPRPQEHPLLKLRAVLEKRLEDCHLGKSMEFSGFQLAGRPAPPPEGFKEPSDYVSLSMTLDNPQAPSERVRLDVMVREYFDRNVATGRYWRSLASAPAENGAIHFENKHGYDLLALKGAATIGLSGQYYIQAGLSGMKDHKALLCSDAVPNPDYGWWAGVAELVLDAWKEARGLPHADGSIVPVVPGKVTRGLASATGLVQVVSVPQTPEEMNTAPQAPPVHPLLKLRAVLEKRLAPYHPVKGFEFPHFYLANRPANSPTDIKKLSNNISLTLYMDNPKDPSRRLALGVDVYEYSEPKIATDGYWSSLRSVPSGSGGIHFQNKHGYDLLALQGSETVGVSDQYRIDVEMSRMKSDPNEPLLNSDAAHNPDYGWWAGWAEFVLDAWKEARGLPHAGGVIVPVAPGKVFRAMASRNGLINVVSVPQTLEEMNTAPKAPPVPAAPQPGK